MDHEKNIKKINHVEHTDESLQIDFIKYKIIGRSCC